MCRLRTAACLTVLLASTSSRLFAQDFAQYSGRPLAATVEKAAALAAFRAVLPAGEKVRISRIRVCGFEVIDPACPPLSSYSRSPQELPTMPNHDPEIFKAVTAAFAGTSRRGVSVRYQRPLLRGDSIVTFLLIRTPESGSRNSYETTYRVTLTNAANPHVLSAVVTSGSHNTP